jgi:hypothetical protein
MDVNAPPSPAHHEEESSSSFLLTTVDTSSPRLRPNLINRSTSSNNNTPERRGGGTTTITSNNHTKAWSLLPTINEHEFQLHGIVDNAHTRSVLFAILLPIAATVTTDVWFDYILMSSSSSIAWLSSLDYDIVLLLTNVSGAFIDGFLQSYENGVVLPMGATTEAIRLLSTDFRLYYISTYTSWSGMVNVAATLSIARSTGILGGILYIIISILLAFIVHGFGSDIAIRITTSTVSIPMANEAYVKPYARKATRLLKNYILCLVVYIVLPYFFFLGNDILNEDPPTDTDSNNDNNLEDVHKFWIKATPRNQFAISAFFAVVGASMGRALSSTISLSIHHNTLIPMETLLCNGIFGMLGLILNIMKISDRSWGDSLLLRGFAINFCGAASLFARHTADNRRLYSEKKRGGPRRAVINMAANIGLAMMIFWIGVEIQEWIHPDINYRRRGVVMRIMKILERRKTLQESQVVEMNLG